MSDKPDMKDATLKDRVLERLDALGVGAVEAATRAGMERNFIRDIVEKGKKSVRADNMRKLASALETTPDWLQGLPEERGTRSSQPTPRYEPNASPPVPIDYPTDRLPMLGSAIGGEDGRFVLNGSKVADVLCPPQLRGVPNAYGVFVNGTSMEPRYFSGEAVFVNPHLPVKQGDFVVVQIAGDFEGDNPAGFVKRFVSMNSRELVLEQYQERDLDDPGALPGDIRTIRIPRARVVAVHKIVGSGIA